MKILFALSNENITEAIKKEYQKNYKTQLTTKNVYYFNAIIKELQNNKTYDVIVINEELEPFNTINYDTIDKFLLEKLKTIREEATNAEGNVIPIIFITTDRHILGDEFITKLYEIGIYNSLVGNDRNFENVCTLMFHPRNKQEARAYYRVNADIDNTPKEDDVKEEEIKNIILHYKKLGRAEEKYVESFNNIASQYSDAQLKVIIRFLPLNVKAVLEAQSPKYQSLTTFAGPSNSSATPYAPPSIKNMPQADKNKQVKEKKVVVNTNNDRVLEQISSVKNASDVVIPNAMNINKVRKIEQLMNEKLGEDENIGVIRNRRISDKQISDDKNVKDRFDEAFEKDIVSSEVVEKSEIEIEGFNSDAILPGFDDVNDSKVQEANEDIFIPGVEKEENSISTEEPVAPVKRGRGRPRKNPQPVEVSDTPKRGRGRPKKVQPVVEEPVIENEAILPGFDEDTVVENESVLPGFEENTVVENEAILPGFNEDTVTEIEETLPGFEENTVTEIEETLPGFDEVNNNEVIEDTFNSVVDNVKMTTNMSEKQMYRYENIEYLIPADKRIVSFIGTSKSGVSFIVNSLGQMLSSFNIDVAILDMTKNRNTFYIYTNNEEVLRNKAEKSIYNLLEGEANGIKVNKNLTVYTALPTDTEDFYEADRVLKTLLDNHSVVLIDCDYDTPIGYFDNSTDMFLVQNMDVLTIQPLTTFLKELKAKNILKQEKLRFITNMETKVKGVNAYDLLGGVSSYKAPSMEYIVDLFVPSSVQLFTIPFDIEAYNKYLTSIAQCEMSLNGYSKTILTSLKNIATCIYPLLSTDKKSKKGNTYTPPSLATTGFNSNMQNTLNQMKNKY